MAVMAKSRETDEKESGEIIACVGWDERSELHYTTHSTVMARVEAVPCSETFVSDAFLRPNSGLFHASIRPVFRIADASKNWRCSASSETIPGLRRPGYGTARLWTLLCQTTGSRLEWKQAIT
jgi:hypothetical protein